MAIIDVSDTHGQSTTCTPSNVCFRVMAKHPELCLVVTALALMILGRYGSSMQTKPVIEPPKEPKRFFPSQSAVIDLPYGNLEPVVNILEREKLIFVMYYAPWCAKSMTMRWEFQKAAKFMQNQVKFIGINCWWPEGSCRKRYKFVMFPVLYAYHSALDGYRYLGAASAEYMVKFLEDLIYPISLLHTEHQVLDLVARHDTVVLAYFGFNASPQPPGYLQYYYASMRSVEHDPYQIIKYCVITQSSLAAVYNLTHVSDIALLRSVNTSLIFPPGANYTSSYIVSWVLQNRQKPLVKWITPLGVKSLTLSRQISQGPSVVLFTPVDQLFDINIFIHMLKSIALHYSSDCFVNNSFSSSDVIESWHKYSFQTIENYKDLLRACENAKKTNVTKMYSAKCCVTVVNQSDSKNMCELCQHTESVSPIIPSSPHCALNFLSQPLMLKLEDLNSNVCLNSQQSYNINKHSSFCCQAGSKEEQKSQSQETFQYGRRPTDRYVYRNLEVLPLRLCKRVTLQKVQKLSTIASVPDFDIPSDFSSLGCKQNRSIGFYAIDSMHQSLFAQRLGVNLQQLSHSPTVVIIDKEAEEHYILKENMTTPNVANFVVNFTLGNLRRHLVSAKPSTPTCGEGDVCVTELTSKTFHQHINTQNQDVVVLVYAPWCGFCISVNHFYLSLAKYFKQNHNILFTRIDGDANDIPWEYTVEQYPTIMFFPANRKSDSVVYPESVPYTLPNLVRFVLKHSTYSLRTEAAVSVCTSACLLKNKEYAKRVGWRLKQQLSRMWNRLSQLNRFKSDFVEVTASVVKRKIQKLNSQLVTVRKLEKYLQTSNNGIHYSELVKFISSQ